MTRDPRFDVLFEPIKIGPVTAKNRFYQVPHCTGVGHRLPRAHAALREVKAEGGWAVVNTELCSVHPTGELWPFPESRLWNDDDERAFNLLTESIHRHGALAGCELGLTGLTMANAYSREVPLAPSNQPNAHTTAPIHARA